MIKIAWLDNDAQGWVDELSDVILLHGPSNWSFQHRCVHDSGDEVWAMCEVSSDDTYVVLQYPGRQQVWEGATRLTRAVGGLRPGVEWAEPGRDFEAASALLEQGLPDPDGLTEVAMTLVAVRKAQSAFRQDMLETFEGRCVVTGLTWQPLLEAAHIAPWKDGKGRTERDNGLLLAAHFHRLFDNHDITFDNNGVLLWAAHVDDATRTELKRQVKPNSRVPMTDARRAFMSAHRAATKLTSG